MAEKWGVAAGRRPAVLASFIGRVLGIKSAAIDFCVLRPAIRRWSANRYVSIFRITDLYGSCPARTPSILHLLIPGPRSTELPCHRKTRRLRLFASLTPRNGKAVRSAAPPADDSNQRQ
jgi:hypothetical protein